MISVWPLKVQLGSGSRMVNLPKIALKPPQNHFRCYQSKNITIRLQKPTCVIYGTAEKSLHASKTLPR